METEPWGIFSLKKRVLKKRKYGVSWKEKKRSKEIWGGLGRPGSDIRDSRGGHLFPL